MNNDKYRQRLSAEENQYLERYVSLSSARVWLTIARYDALVSNLTHAQVLSLLPTKLHAFDEAGMSESTSISHEEYAHQYTVPEPDLDQAVYALARRECGPVRLPEYVHCSFGRVELILHSGRLLTLEKGSIHMLRYRSIREQLREGEVQLI